MERLKELLGLDEGDYDGDEEYYKFTWYGKNMALRNSISPTLATLRPVKGESKDWDTTQNIFIEGDNLEVLKVLQKTYHNKIKMIYIDPPYNTGKDFIYKDSTRDSIEEYLEFSDQITNDGFKYSTNTETSGRYHTNWLNMIYPRIKLAHSLLKDDGVIFISIDDNEVHNLRKVCDEIFGEDNFRNYITTRRRVKSLNIQFANEGLKSLNVGLEYILVYSKSDLFRMNALRVEKINKPTKGTWNVFWSGADRPTMRYEVLGFTPLTGQWRWSQKNADIAVENYNEYSKNYADKMTLEQYWHSTNEELKFIRRIENGTGKNGGVQYWCPIGHIFKN